MAGIERLSIDDQSSNRELYDLLNREGYYDGWLPEIQRANFEVLATIGDRSGFPLKGASCLDVGCGTGELAGFLQDRGIGNYLGIDLVSSSIELARQRHRDMPFRQGDVLVEPKDETFDFVFCSGAMTLKFDSGNYEYMKKMIARMLELAKRGIAFNYIADSAHVDTSYCFVFDRKKVRKICDSLGVGKRMDLATMPNGAIQDTVFIRK